MTVGVKNGRGSVQTNRQVVVAGMVSQSLHAG